VITPAAKFQDAIRQAAALVDEAPGRLVTFGIRPTYPAESFGYIQQGAALAVAPGAAPAHVVARFREKPPAQVATEYLAAGNYLWNAGIFVWKAATILAALRERQPECLAHLERIAAAWDGPDREAVFAREFAAIKGISIDYAVLEHAPYARSCTLRATTWWSRWGSRICLSCTPPTRRSWPIGPARRRFARWWRNSRSAAGRSICERVAADGGGARGGGARGVGPGG
jgi:mannose-1-phosphate guanylyltransferase